MQEEQAQSLKYLHSKKMKVDGFPKMGSEMRAVAPLVRLFPLAENEVLLRAANLGDLFDQRSPSQYLDVNEYATSLYAQANGGRLPRGVEIIEQNLQGTAKKTESKFRWKHKGPVLKGTPASSPQFADGPLDQEITNSLV